MHAGILRHVSAGLPSSHRLRSLHKYCQTNGLSLNTRLQTHSVRVCFFFKHTDKEVYTFVHIHEETQPFCESV